MARRTALRVLTAVVPFVGLAIGIGVLVSLVDVGEALATVVRADPWGVGAAMLLALNATLLVGLKLWAVVRIVDLPRSFGQTWSAVMAGLTLNAVLPGRGGDLVRAVFLVRDGSGLTVLLGAVLVERLIDVFTLGLLVLLTGLGLDVVTGAAALACAAAVGGTALLAVLGPRVPLRPDLGERVARTAGQVARRPGWAALATLLSLLTWANNTAMLVVTLWAVGVQVPFVPAFRAGAVSILAGIVPITLSGIGTRDTALVLALSPFGQAEGVAAAGLLYTVLMYWFLAAIGAGALGLETLRTVRRAVEARRGSDDEGSETA
jgi:glycosyltransferase 2 family protein